MGKGKDKDKDRDKDKKHKSLCHFLNHFEGRVVTLRTRSGDVIEGTLREVKSDLVMVVQSVMISPFMEDQLTVIRCGDIESFSVDFIED